MPNSHTKWLSLWRCLHCQARWPENGMCVPLLGWVTSNKGCDAIGGGKKKYGKRFCQSNSVLRVNKIPSLTHLLLKTAYHPDNSSRDNSSSTSNSPSLEHAGLGMRFWSGLWSSSPSTHPSVSLCLCPLQLPRTLTLLLWHQSFFAPLFNSPSLSLPVSHYFSLPFPVLVRACWWQSDLWVLWTQLTFLLRSLALPLSLWFLLPVEESEQLSAQEMRVTAAV